MSVDEKTVTFRYIDYSNGTKEQKKTVSGKKIIGLNLHHVLPSGFHSFRFTSYLTNRRKLKI